MPLFHQRSLCYNRPWNRQLFCCWMWWKVSLLYFLFSRQSQLFIPHWNSDRNFKRIFQIFAVCWERRFEMSLELLPDKSRWALHSSRISWINSYRNSGWKRNRLVPGVKSSIFPNIFFQKSQNKKWHFFIKIVLAFCEKKLF